MAEVPLRVLIVDDEAPARRRLRELLDDCASALPLAVVGEAQNGREAVELLQSIPVDLVLTDIHMPDMDGLELARHVLKVPHTPLVVFTTAFHEHAVQAFEVNAIDYLMKPVRLQRLLAALQKVPRLKPVSAEKLAQLPGACLEAVAQFFLVVGMQRVAHRRLRRSLAAPDGVANPTQALIRRCRRPIREWRKAPHERPWMS